MLYGFFGRFFHLSQIVTQLINKGECSFHDKKEIH